MSQADDVFVKNFLAVLGALVLFTVIAFVLARTIGFGAEEEIQASPQAVIERIQPIGQLRIGQPGDEPVPVMMQTAAAPPAATPAAAEQTGEQVYNATCMACHTTGAAGAPTLEKDVWTDRAAQGLEVLVQHAINGKNAMPPKGGNTSLSDEDVKRAVEYMLTQAGVTAQ